MVEGGSGRLLPFQRIGLRLQLRRDLQQITHHLVADGTTSKPPGMLRLRPKLRRSPGGGGGSFGMEGERIAKRKDCTFGRHKPILTGSGMMSCRRYPYDAEAAGKAGPRTVGVLCGGSGKMHFVRLAASQSTPIRLSGRRGRVIPSGTELSASGGGSWLAPAGKDFVGLRHLNLLAERALKSLRRASCDSSDTLQRASSASTTRYPASTASITAARTHIRLRPRAAAVTTARSGGRCVGAAEAAMIVWSLPPVGRRHKPDYGE